MLKHLALVVLGAFFLATVQAQEQTKPKPKPAAKTKPATKSKAETAQPDPKIIEEILACLAHGLPQDWKKTWVVVTELETDGKTRKFEAKFFFATSPSDDTGQPLTPCDAEAVAKDVYRLNETLKPEQRQWKVAKLVITSEGNFELRYDYEKR
ncbi:MAG: hypothetical protein ACREUO_07840 [Burkholderiales bacterium]